MDAELQVGEGLWSRILQQLDKMPLTRGCSLEFGVVGRSGHSGAQLRGHQFIRGPDMQSNVSVLIYIGPELSKPPTPPAVSQTHKLVAELFSTGLSCSLAVMGWVGTIGSIAGAGASMGMSSLATIYFANAAALASAQCVGSTVHAGLVGWDEGAKADAMADNTGFKTFDRVADYTNFLAILSVGRNLVTVSRALKEAGLSISEGALAQFADKDIATMAKFLKLTKDANNAESVASFIKVVSWTLSFTAWDFTPASVTTRVAQSRHATLCWANQPTQLLRGRVTQTLPRQQPLVPPPWPR